MNQAPPASGFGPCCACEGEISPRPYVMFLEFEGPPGFHGWGCLPCALPTRGAIAVLCTGCMRAQKLPKFIAAGVNVGDNKRIRLDDKFQQIPFLHDPRRHPEGVPRGPRRRIQH